MVRLLLMKTCSKCGHEKPFENFKFDSRYMSGRYCWCYACVEDYNRSPERKKRDRIRRRIKFSDPIVRNEHNKKARIRYTNPQEKRRHKNETYRRKYHVTLEFFESEVEKQQSRCALCNQKRKLVVDHDHKTGEYRGAICRLCNVALGRIELIPDFLSKIQEYIQ
jgi:hypothetical protein